MMDLNTRIEESKMLANWIGDQVDGLELNANERTRVSAALISVSLGHHASMLELFGLGRHASALALLRSMIDCFVRAMWVKGFASDEEIRAFIAGNDPPGTQKLILQLESEGPIENLSSILSANQWATICDFNHGGGRMIVRHLTSEEIAPNFEAEELVEVVVAADAWALVCTCALADLADDRDLGERVLKRGQALAA